MYVQICIYVHICIQAYMWICIYKIISIHRCIYIYFYMYLYLHSYGSIFSQYMNRKVWFIYTYTRKRVWLIYQITVIYQIILTHCSLQRYVKSFPTRVSVHKSHTRASKVWYPRLICFIFQSIQSLCAMIVFKLSHLVCEHSCSRMLFSTACCCLLFFSYAYWRPCTTTTSVWCVCVNVCTRARVYAKDSARGDRASSRAEGREKKQAGTCKAESGSTGEKDRAHTHAREKYTGKQTEGETEEREGERERQRARESKRDDER